jgi:hypothetical protein
MTKQKNKAQIKFEKATKLSQILAIALSDLKKAEKSKHYIISMNNWHKPTDYKQCMICLAGSVMAYTLHYNKQTNYDTLADHNKVPKNHNRKFNALNDLRTGWIDQAYRSLKNRPPGPKTTQKLNTILSTLNKQFDLAWSTTGLIQWTTSSYGWPTYHSPNWWPIMTQLLKHLKQAGL